MKLSVVLPCYNGEKYLETALKSIKTQTIQPHEILLIDDGSQDNSVEIAKDYGIEIYRNTKNMGIGYTRQRGLDLSTGTHIAFLSVDDAYTSNFIETSKKVLGGNKATYTDYYRCDHRLKPHTLFKTPSYSREEVIKWALSKNMFINFSSIIIPKEIPSKFVNELRHGEDLIFLLDSIINGIEWTRVPKPLIYYRIHEKQGTKTKNYEEFNTLWKYIINRLYKLGVDKPILIQSYKESHRKFSHKNNLLRILLKRLRHSIPNPTCPETDPQNLRTPRSDLEGRRESIASICEKGDQIE